MVMKVNPSKGTFDIRKYIETETDKKLKSAVLQWQKIAPGKIIQNLKSTIASGNSPVKGNGRFVGYSPSYTEAIKKGRYPGKKLRPVNLTLSGAMMRSLIYRPTKGGFVIYFTNKLAKIHSEQGAGKSRVIRKVMPSDKEQFKPAITRESDVIVNKILKEELGNMF
jgi:hypothetical protein